ncbi:MAG TPA: DUF3883 domain-containing protein [Candidatus Nitrosotalea sp.]|nr:DUF3883 domain-containing protein [Candidatus Nitrosotalea sp.]
MANRLYEFNRVVVAIDDLSQGDENGISQATILDSLNKISLRARSTNALNLIEDSIKLGLIKREGNRIYLTNNGRRLYSLQHIQDGTIIIDVTYEQKEFLFGLILNSVQFEKDLHQIFSDFRPHYVKKVWFYDSKAINSNWNQDLANYLFEIGVFHITDDGIEVTKNHRILASRIRNDISKTEEDLYKLLEMQREVGATAEELTLSYERTRLEKLGRVDLALSVQQISKIDVFAGYDVESFDGTESGLVPDRMIEVKGTSTEKPTFYWTENEKNVAKRLGSRYWLYVWINVSSEGSGKLYKIIQNPYEEFFVRGGVNPEPVLYKIGL